MCIYLLGRVCFLENCLATIFYYCRVHLSGFNCKHKNLVVQIHIEMFKTLLEPAPSDVTQFFLERSNFSLKYLNWFRTSADNLKSSIWKHTTCATKAFFLPLFSRNFNDQLSSNFHRFVILCICWDTPSGSFGDWSLTSTKGVQPLTWFSYGFIFKKKKRRKVWKNKQQILTIRVFVLVDTSHAIYSLIP